VKLGMPSTPRWAESGAIVGSIFVPTIVAKTGSILLTAGQDIDVPSLTAGANISTISINGVTNIVTATSNGAISMTGGQTITFRQITAGGAGGNVNLVSTGGFVLGIPSLAARIPGIGCPRPRSSEDPAR